MTRLSVKALTLITLVFGISSQAAKADVDLTDGIRAFICEGQTLAIQETEEGWAFASGFPLSKTIDGWRWENDGSAYLSERKSGEWVLEVLSPQGYLKSACIDITSGVTHVVEVVKPKLNKNITAVIEELAKVKESNLSLTRVNLSLISQLRLISKLQSELAKVKESNLSLTTVNSSLISQVSELQKRLSELQKPLKLPSGPPLTSGEKDALRVAVMQCWNVGSLSSVALETTVVVAVSLSQDGKPVTSSIRQIGSEGGTAASVKQAFETARRAIIRCGARGFQLPSDKYDQWKDIEMTFDPERMRIE